MAQNNMDSSKNTTLTISALAKQFGLSRSTLLYYDSKGLLSPSGHLKGEYRIYGEKEVQKLKQICIYRNAGLSLKAIRTILDTPDSDFSAILTSRFEELNKEMIKLQEQQRIIAELLQRTSSVKAEKMDKELWTSILSASGLSEADMRNWHITFENQAPEQHKAFLQYLQIPDNEIDEIRSWAGDSSSKAECG